MARGSSDYTERVLNNKQFIFGGIAVVIGSLSIGTVLLSLSSYEEVIAYQKTEVTTASLSVPSEEYVEIVSEEEVEPDEEETQPSREISNKNDEDDEEELEELSQIKPKKKVTQSVPVVPFYSQFNDITPASWKKVGCGIASLAMLIEYYNPGEVVVDTLLQEGIDANAYLDSAGWTYAGLIGISKKYGMGGQTYDFGNLSMENAYKELLAGLEEGPVMASVHYTFQKTNPIPHLVIINGIEDGKVYYNDPAEKEGGGSISVAQFQSAWKKRYIEFRLM